MEKYLAMLLKTPLFNGIEIEGFNHVLNCLESNIVTYNKNEIIYSYFDQIEYAGIVLEGEVEASMLNETGNEHSIKIYTQGMMFFESQACVNQINNGILVKAKMNTKILFLKLSNLYEVTSYQCKHAFKVTANLLHIAAQSNLFQNKKIQILTQKSVRDKVIVFLNEYLVNSHIIYLDYNRQELANYLNVERSALSRELSRMKNEGLIEYHKNKITVLDKSYFLN